MNKPKEPKRVLFVCIGNSCRSPMAEAIARARYPNVIEASSAGIGPAAIIQPETIACLKEIEVPVYDDMRPTALADADWASADVIVNMSGMTILPMIPGFKGGNLIWEIEDPIGRPMDVYRSARKKIERKLEQLFVMLRGCH